MENPALLVGQPIGYRPPAPGRRLALGLADPLDGLELGPGTLAAPLADPRLVATLGTPTTRTAAEGIVTAGAGQAPTPASSAPIHARPPL
jgi:hypothetical protein